MMPGRGWHAAFARVAIAAALLLPAIGILTGCGGSPIPFHKVANGETDQAKPYVPNYLPEIETYRWAEGSEITVNIHRERIAQALGYVENDTRTGFLLWDGPINRNGQHLSFLFANGPPGPADNQIDVEFVAPGALKDGVIGRATPVVKGGFILSARVQVDSGLYLKRNLFLAVVCHEAAHAYGVGGHSDDPRSIMYWRVPAGEPFRDTVTTADVNTIRSIYENRVPADLAAELVREGRSASAPTPHEIRMETHPDGIYLICDLPGRKRSRAEILKVGPSAPLPSSTAP